MGYACSKPAPELAAATPNVIERLRQRGHLPCIACPSVDFEGDNELHTLYVAEYENGTELTMMFLDEDRSRKCEDCMYDTVRKPLFGRSSDIETVFIIKDEVDFPGTYAGEQAWDAELPEHREDKVKLATFQRMGPNGVPEGDGSVSAPANKNQDQDKSETSSPPSTTTPAGPGDQRELVIWVNTWNHLMGEKNTNPTMDITYQHAKLPDSSDGCDTDYILRIGSRAEVDARFSGWLSSLAPIMTEEREKALGKRINSLE